MKERKKRKINENFVYQNNKKHIKLNIIYELDDF